MSAAEYLKYRIQILKSCFPSDLYVLLVPPLRNESETWKLLPILLLLPAVAPAAGTKSIGGKIDKSQTNGIHSFSSSSSLTRICRIVHTCFLLLFFCAMQSTVSPYFECL